MTETVKTERVTLPDGRGFNINFKGACNIPIDFEYICVPCDEVTEIKHVRSATMKGHKCKTCGGILHRYISKPPALDADYHDSIRTENIGWDS